MRAFACDNCHQMIFFENSSCVSCGRALGYLPETGEMVAFPDRPADAEGHPVYTAPEGRTYTPCANLTLAACNWLVPTESESDLCESCELTRTRPADDDVDGMAQWLNAEVAKRRLLFQLHELGLPVVSKDEDPELGLAFDLLSSASEQVITGHDNGLITVDLAEGDDPHREAVRLSMGEAYRTMLGHFRHEIGHHYWDVLIAQTAALQSFRELFGDDTLDYQAEIDRHYNEGPPANWVEEYVSSYATMHPWEDWAETFAHYLHIRDTLQTAASFGVTVQGPVAPVKRTRANPLSARPRDDYETLEQAINQWLPLTYALNAINRSMGKEDLYPFVLPEKVLDKLELVHDVVSDPPPITRPEPEAPAADEPDSAGPTSVADGEQLQAAPA